MLRPNIESLSLGHFLALLIDAYKDVFKTSVMEILGTSLRDVLRTLVGHVRWSYILDHVGVHNVCRRRPQDISRGRFLALHVA